MISFLKRGLICIVENVFKFCPCGLEKHLKINMAPFFIQQQFTLYPHLDVLQSLTKVVETLTSLCCFYDKFTTSF